VKINSTSFWLFIIIAFIVNACAYNKSKIEDVKIDDKKPQTIFLNFDVFRAPDNNINAKLIDKIVVDGAIKKNNAAIKNPVDGDLKCIELDEENNPVQSFYLGNPLNKNIEYVNDEGQLASKYVELDTAQLSIRMQLHQQTQSITLERLTGQTNKTKTIINIKLN